jgi:hypothetical protein
VSEDIIIPAQAGIQGVEKTKGREAALSAERPAFPPARE